jgi:hypothetical protein
MGTFVLLLALLASNGWWLFVTVDQGVSLSYARQPNGTYARQPNGDLRVQACDGQLLATALGQACRPTRRCDGRSASSRRRSGKAPVTTSCGRPGLYR